MYGWSVGINEWFMEVFLVIKFWFMEVFLVIKFRNKGFRVYV
jgi:hypothetical protein